MPTTLINSIKQHTYVYLLVALLIFHAVFNLYWQKLNTAPPTWDSAGHLAISYIFTDQLNYFFKGEASITRLLKISGYYPPFVHILGSMIFLTIGRNYELPLYIVGTSFLIIALLFLYKLVVHYTHNPKLALLTAFIFSFFPQIWEQSRNFHLDIPLCALVLVCNYYLVKSQGFSKRRESLLFFLFLAFVQITKWYGFVFLLIPVYFELFILPAKLSESMTTVSNEKRVSNIILGSLFILFLTLPWYIANMSTLMANIKVSSTADAGDPTNVLSYESLFHYLKLMTSHQIGIVSLILLILGLIRLKKDYPDYFKYVTYAIMVPYLVFTLISNKDLRYILPLAPYFAFAIAYLLTKINSYLTGLIGSVAYLAYLISVFLFLSLNQFAANTPSLRWIGTLISGQYGFTWVTEPTAYSYNGHDWQGNEILQTIQHTADNKGMSFDHFKVLEIADNRFYSTASFDLYKLQNRYYNMDFIVPYFRFSPFSPTELDEYISPISFAIVPDNPGPPGLRNIQVLNQLVEYFKSQTNTKFSVLKVFKMPDGNTMTVYQRKNLSTNLMQGDSSNKALFKVANILFIDKEKYGIDPFTIDFTYKSGQQKKETIVSNSAQIRMPLHMTNDEVEKFIVNLPSERMYVEQLQGWVFKGGEFVRDRSFGSSNTLIYRDFHFESLSQTESAFTNSKVKVSKSADMVTISLITNTDTSFVAYATVGWKWNSVNLTPENTSVSIPLKDLIQIEVTSDSILSTDFDNTWGIFSCYEGRAVCYYPLTDNLEI